MCSLKTGCGKFEKLEKKTPFHFNDSNDSQSDAAVFLLLIWMGDNTLDLSINTSIVLQSFVCSTSFPGSFKKKKLQQRSKITCQCNYPHSILVSCNVCHLIKAKMLALKTLLMDRYSKPKMSPALNCHAFTPITFQEKHKRKKKSCRSTQESINAPE